MLSALADAGWDARTAEVVVGTSAGSIAAAMLRAGVAPGALRTPGSGRRAGTAAPLAPVGIEAAALAPGRVSVGGLLSRLVPAGTRSVGGIVTMVRGAAGDGWPRATTWVCAARRRDGRRVVFGRAGSPPAPLSLAVAASCAIPGYFTPCRSTARRTSTAACTPRPTSTCSPASAWTPSSSARRCRSRAARSRPGWTCPPGCCSAARSPGRPPRVRRSGTPVLTFQPTAEDLAVTGLNAMSPGPWASLVEQAEASTRRRLQDPALARVLLGGLNGSGPAPGGGAGPRTVRRLGDLNPGWA